MDKKNIYPLIAVGLIAVIASVDTTTIAFSQTQSMKGTTPTGNATRVMNATIVNKADNTTIKVSGTPQQLQDILMHQIQLSSSTIASRMLAMETSGPAPSGETSMNVKVRCHGPPRDRTWELSY
jgi:hypothetical protein